MKKLLFFALATFLLVSCKSGPESPETSPEALWEPYDETAELQEQESNENPRLRFKLLNSKFLDKNEIWAPFDEELKAFSEGDYQALAPLILEKDIPSLQGYVAEGKLTYERLVLFYLYRIRKYESDNQKTLNAIIALNPNVVEQARQRDKDRAKGSKLYSLYGMPILLKDNINTQAMPTTAGAVVLAENETGNAFIVDRLLNAGALILGKVNLSEWAYYFCEDCPLGYSAVGGQTLNPYGRKLFETGGSSSGSAVAVAANYGVAAVGTETAGSILSPSAKNSVVGLKPTVGLLSRSGIIPISSTLDTPGPITRTVIDNAILLQAMTGMDAADKASVAAGGKYLEAVQNASLEGKRIGVMKSLLEDSLYSGAVEELRNLGASIVEYEAPEASLEGFLTLLNMDMKMDLPAYLEAHAGKAIEVRTIKDIVKFNLENPELRAPYGQGIFEEILRDSTSPEELQKVREQLLDNGRRFFDLPMDKEKLDVVLSIDNYHAAIAAVAKYPALAVPMGFNSSGEPKSLTFIARPFEEDLLLQLGFIFEKKTRARKAPAGYN